MKKNPETPEYLRDEFRDDTLTEAQRKKFEEALESDDELRAAFERESQWLDLLGEPTKEEAQQLEGGEAFAAAVLDRWEEERENGGVIGRISWKSAIFSGAWVAAAAVIAFMMYINAPVNEPTDDRANNVAMNSSRSNNFDGDGYRGHPLTAVVNRITEDFHEQPKMVARMVDGARSWMDVENLADQFGIQPVSYSEETR